MKIGIKAKFIIFLLLPVFSLLYFYLINLSSSLNELKIFTKMSKNISKVVRLSELVHFVQIERGFSVRYLSNEVDFSELEKNRLNTDNVIKNIKKSTIYNGNVVKLVTEIEDSLKNIREKINSVTVDEIIDLYGEQIQKLLNEYYLAVNAQTTAGFGKILTTLYSLEISKENIGNMRSRVTYILNKKNPVDIKTLEKIIKNKESGFRFLEDRSLILSEKSKNSIIEIANSKSFTYVVDAYKNLIENYRSGEYSYSGTIFFTNISYIIDNLYQIVLLENDSVLVNLDKKKKNLFFNVFVSTLISSIVLLVIVIGGYIFASFITGPLKQTVKVLNDISRGEGDLTVKLEVKSNDEIQFFSEHFNTFVSKLRQIVDIAKGVGNDSINISKELNKTAIENDRKINDFFRAMQNIKEKMDILDRSVLETRNFIGNISKSIEKIVSIISNQSSSVAESSSSIEEMVSTIASITNVVRERKNASDNLVIKARSGDDSMNETLSSINDISQDTEVIFQLIEVINSVTEKTDLLAMNAAIEAAHAGEAGKGFAVVADEIRNLAEATNQKSLEINKSLKSIADKIKKTQEITKSTSSIINEIINGIIEFSNSMNELLLSINEIKIGSDQILIALKEIVDITETLKESSVTIDEDAKKIFSIVLNLANVSSETNKNILDIVENLNELKNSINVVMKLSENNREKSELLNAELSKFKT